MYILYLVFLRIYLATFTYYDFIALKRHTSAVKKTVNTQPGVSVNLSASSSLVLKHANEKMR